MRFPALDAAGVELGTFRDRSGKEFRREVEGLVDRYVAETYTHPRDVLWWSHCTANVRPVPPSSAD